MRNLKAREQTNLSKYLEEMKTSRRVKIAIGILFLVVSFLLIFISSLPKRYDVKVGEIATEDIIAPRKITDVVLTEKLRRQAEKQTPNVYDYITSAEKTSKANVNRLFKSLNEFRGKELTKENIEIFNSSTDIDLDGDTYELLFKKDKNALSQMKKAVLSELDTLYEQEVSSDSMDSYYEKIDDHFTASVFDHETSEALKTITKKALKANMVLNEEATRQAKDKAANSVEDIVYQTGEIIVKKGDIITQNQIDILKSGNMVRSGLFSNVNSLIGIALLLILMTAIYVLYLRTFHSEVYYNNKLLALIAVQFWLVLLLGRIATAFNVYLIPISVFSITLCMMINPRVAINTNIFMILFVSMALDINIEEMVYLILSGFAGILFMQGIQERSKIYRASIFVSLVNLCTIFVYSIMNSTVNASMITNMVFAVANGLLSGVISLGLMLFWEYLFNILTPFKMLELQSPSNELIKRLITTAPGTYHHSLLVGNMAQEACEEIGADGLLAKVGALYHDIGKCEKPMFFSENQSASQNPHDHLDPNVSARIIKNHVSDGLYLANRFRLPEEIVEFIRTHHGDTLIKYFYYKEKKEKGIEPDMRVYTYDGPRPSSVETSVVLLADGVEAAVRSLDTSDVDLIRDMIDKIVTSKIDEDQLDNSDLKIKDIEVIKESFLKVLTGVYHERVQYPGQKKPEERER